MTDNIGDYYIVGTGAPRTVGDVQAYANRHGLALPEDIIWFLSHAANGGKPRPVADFPIADLPGGEYMYVHGFLGIEREENYYELAIFLGFEPVVRILPRAFPIGYDSLGGYLLLVTEEEHRGEIRYSPDDEFANPYVVPNLYFVAPNIKEFVRMIQRFQRTGNWY